MDSIAPIVKKLLLFLLLFHTLIALREGSTIVQGGLIGPDSYMHLNRILALVENGDWYSSLYPRSNAPYGEELHWTRLFDIILLSGSGLFLPLFPFDKALHLWGVLVSPILHGIALVGLLWGLKPSVSKDHLLLAGGLFIVQPAIFGYCMPGKADHHSLILALFVWLQACTLRMLGFGIQKPFCLMGGVLSALLIWASLEGFLGLAISLLALTGCWWVYGKDFSQKGWYFATSLFLTTTLALVIERPWQGWAIVEYDRFSIVHWTAMLLIWLFWTTIFVLQDHLQFSLPKVLRGIIILTGVGIAGFIQGVVFPGFFQGPFAAMDSTVMSLHWNHIAETQPLISLNPLKVGDFVFYLGISLLAIPNLIFLLYRNPVEPHRRFWLYLGIALCILTPIAILQIRSAIFAVALLIIPYSALLLNLGRKILKILPNGTLAIFIQGLLVLIGSIGFPASGLIIGNLENSSQPHSQNTCPISLLSTYFNQSPIVSQKTQTILAHVNFGPELLYRTPHQVVSTPYHRNMSSIVDTNSIMQSKTEEEARAILRSRKVDLILFCPNSGERGYYSLPQEKPIFYDNLLAGKIPNWITPLPLDEELSKHFKLYAITDRSSADKQ